MVTPELNDIEKELLGAEGLPHAELMQEVHDAFMRLHGFGGVAILVGCVAAPLALRAAVEGASSLQLALVAVGALLVGLTTLRWASHARAARLNARVATYCEQHQTTPSELSALSRRLGDRWFFFRALLSGGDGEGLAADGRRGRA